jgi:uncharacterized membrane protein YphA (DoxX/SURF4 family)
MRIAPMVSAMKRTKLVYGISTGLLAAAFALGGLTDLAQTKDMTAGFAHLGYPAYLLTLLGLWKLLGAVAVAVPRFPRLKEWAYAGMFFDLTGAAWSHFSSGDGIGKIVTPLAILALGAVSWASRPATRTLVEK